MQLFYFHIRRGDTVNRDEYGTQLETPEHARIEAVRMLSDMAREEFPRDGDHQRIGVDIYDAAGRHAAQASISFDFHRTDNWDRSGAAGAGAGK